MSKTFLVISDPEDFRYTYARMLDVAKINSPYYSVIETKSGDMHIRISRPRDLRGRQGKIIIFGSWIQRYKEWRGFIDGMLPICAESNSEPILMTQCGPIKDD